MPVLIQSSRWLHGRNTVLSWGLLHKTFYRRKLWLKLKTRVSTILPLTLTQEKIQVKNNLSFLRLRVLCNRPQEWYGSFFICVLRSRKFDFLSRICRCTKDHAGCLPGVYMVMPEITQMIPEQWPRMVRVAIREWVKAPLKNLKNAHLSKKSSDAHRNTTRTAFVSLHNGLQIFLDTEILGNCHVFYKHVFYYSSNLTTRPWFGDLGLGLGEGVGTRVRV